MHEREVPHRRPYGGGLPRLLALCGLLFSGIAGAQSAPPEPVQLVPLTVTAIKQTEDALLVPAAVDVIEADEIRRAKPRINLSESLERIPGVVARNRQNYAQDLQISIRGFGARSTFGVRGVRLYNDDIPATTPDGQGQVSHFDLESAQRIEVLRGPFSALYGNASGGVIKLFTAVAADAPQLQGGWVAGSDGLTRSSLSWQSAWGAHDDNDLFVDLVDVSTDGYRRHSAARRSTGQALLRGHTGETGRYTLLFNSLDLSAQDPQGLTAAQLQADPRAASAGALLFNTRKYVRQDQIGLHVEQPVTPNNTFVMTPYATRRNTEQMLSVPVSIQRDNPLQGGGAIALGRYDSGFDARWQWSTRLGSQPFSLTSGVDYEASDERRRGYENFLGDTLGVFGALRRDEHDRVASEDYYAQAQWAPASRWRIDAGIRRSQVRFASRDDYITSENPDDSGRLTYAHTSPVAGVLFRATSQLSLYANAGGGFETPTLAELAYRSDELSGLNDRLRPARSRNYELGLRAHHDALDYSAAIFHSRTQNELAVVANLGGRSVYANAGPALRRGLEIAASGRFLPDWNYAMAYTLLDARYVDGGAPVVGEGHIPGLSRHSLWGEIRWSLDPRAQVVLQGRFFSRIFANDANREFAPAYASFDLALERLFEFVGLQWRGFVRLDNVLDRDIVGSVIVNDANGRYFEPAPGRNWIMGLSISYQVH